MVSDLILIVMIQLPFTCWIKHNRLTTLRLEQFRRRKIPGGNQGETEWGPVNVLPKFDQITPKIVET